MLAPMRALTLCDGCLRHVRVADARCPFCDRPREASAEPALELAPRPLPRAVIATLGVTLSLAACPSRSGVTTSGDRKFYRPAGSIAGAGGGASEALGAAQPRHGRVSRGNLGVLVVDYALVASARGAAEVNET